MRLFNSKYFGMSWMTKEQIGEYPPLITCSSRHTLNQTAHMLTLFRLMLLIKLPANNEARMKAVTQKIRQKQ